MHTTNDLETSSPSIAMRRSVMLKEIDIDMSSLSNQAVIAVFNETCANLGYSLRGRDGVTDQLIERAHGGKGFVFVEVPSKFELAEIENKLAENIQEAVQDKKKYIATKNYKAKQVKDNNNIIINDNAGDIAEMNATVARIEERYIVRKGNHVYILFQVGGRNFIFVFLYNHETGFPQGLPLRKVDLSKFEGIIGKANRRKAIAVSLGLKKTGPNEKADYFILSHLGWEGYSVKLSGKNKPTVLNFSSSLKGTVRVTVSEDSCANVSRLIANQKIGKEHGNPITGIFSDAVNENSNNMQISDPSDNCKALFGEGAASLFHEGIVKSLTPKRQSLEQDEWRPVLKKCLRSDTLTHYDKSKQKDGVSVEENTNADYVHVVKLSGELVLDISIEDLVDNHFDKFIFDRPGLDSKKSITIEGDRMIVFISGFTVRFEANRFTEGVPPNPNLETYHLAQNEITKRIQEEVRQAVLNVETETENPILGGKYISYATKNVPTKV